MSSGKLMSQHSQAPIQGFYANLDVLDQRYLLVDSYRGDLLLKLHDRTTRLKTLQNARTAYRTFLGTNDSYGLLGSYERKAYQTSSDPSPTAFFQIHADATARRDYKIARYKQEKELKAKVEVSMCF